MLSLLGTIFGSIFAGGATGLLGLFLQKYFDIQAKKLENEHSLKSTELELALMDKKLQLANLETEGKVKVAQLQTDAAIGVEEQKAFAQSIAADRATYLTPEVAKGDRFATAILAVLELLRGLVRPVLTLALTYMSWLLYEQTDALMKMQGLEIKGELLQSQLLLISSTILYLTTTVVCWWFGLRAALGPPKIK